MLSFIIIGKNEGWKLSLCLEKVFETIRYNKLTNYEVIYVDSQSTDDTLERVKKFEKIKFVSLTGDCNPAIARNVGAEIAKGDVLFFLDGDMELIPESFHLFYSEGSGISYPFMSGNFDNYFYNDNWEYQHKDNGYSMAEDKYTSHVGGLFFILKAYWQMVGGMDNRFRKGQDVDLALMLAKENILLYRKKEILVHHHMIPYLDRRRKWEMLLSGMNMYGRSLLYRKHGFEKNNIKLIVSREYSLIAFLLSIFLSLVLGQVLALLAYVSVIAYRAYKGKGALLDNIAYFVLKDIITIMGVFLFFPKRKYNRSYEILP